MTDAEGRTPTLTDGVIVLDGHTPADAEGQVAGEDEEQARRFGWYPAHSTVGDVLSAFENLAAQWRENGPTRAFAVRAATSGELVGGCELRLKGEGIGHVSYWIFPDHRRRGYAARALTLLSSYAFVQLRVERLELYSEPDNVGSRGVAHRAGFFEEGTLRRQAVYGATRRDVIIYSRLPSDPPAP